MDRGEPLSLPSTPLDRRRAARHRSCYTFVPLSSALRNIFYSVIKISHFNYGSASAGGEQRRVRSPRIHLHLIKAKRRPSGELWLRLLTARNSSAAVTIITNKSKEKQSEEADNGGRLFFGDFRNR